MLAMSTAGHPHHSGFSELDSTSSLINDFFNPQHFGDSTDQSVMDVLSASSYTEVNNSEQGLRQPSTQYYGGFVTDSDSHADQARPTKKAKQVDDDAEEGNNASGPASLSKKQRGRPRVEPQDETAADRRRTQIRLAQRAYRNRKETTITVLKKRVSQLEGVIEQMDKSFTQLYDNLHETGMGSSTNTNPIMLDQLISTMNEFKHFMKTASLENNDGSEDEMFGLVKANQPTSGSENGSNSDKRVNSVGSNYHISQDALRIPPPILQDRSAALPKFMPSQIAQFESSLVNAVEHGRSLEPLDVPQPSNGAYTYSFQETTFARRLHRQCLERAFRFLSNPSVEPEVISRMFRFSFTFSNRNRMLGRFQNLLRRKAGESLENWNVPFFLIGGAGTHFPRRDENGDPILPPNMLSPARAFGPYQLPTAETPRQEKTIEQLLEAIGFGGDWFDSHDVEEYLKTMGIPLEAQSSFVTVEAMQLRGLDDLSLPGIRSSPSTNSLSSQIEPRLQLEAQNSGLGFTFGQSNMINKLAAQAYVWNQQTDGPFFHFDEQESRTTSPSRRMLTLDVEKFLTLVVEKGVCLGRAPGFRKMDVDASLVASLQEGF